LLGNVGTAFGIGAQVALVVIVDRVADLDVGKGIVHRASLHIAPVSRAMMQDRCDWTPGWTESHSLSYGLREAQVQAHLDKSAPG
jgi:hypothetical protein